MSIAYMAEVVDNFIKALSLIFEKIQKLNLQN